MEQSESHYLEDMVLPEDREEESRFDWKAELGEELVRFTLGCLDWDLRGELGIKRYVTAEIKFAEYKLLSGAFPNLLNPDDRENMIQELERRLREDVYLPNSPVGSNAYYVVITGERQGLKTENREALQQLVHELQKTDSLRVSRPLAEARLWGLEVPALDERQRKNFEKHLRNFIDKYQERNDIPNGFVEELCTYLILAAKDIRLIPGKGIELVDDVPEEFQRGTLALPEVRNF